MVDYWGARPNETIDNFMTTSDKDIAASNVAPFGARVQQQSSNAYANGSNQNCGNVLTDRSSTRLPAPPGGHSSFRLG